MDTVLGFSEAPRGLLGSSGLLGGANQADCYYQRTAILTAGNTGLVNEGSHLHVNYENSHVNYGLKTWPISEVSKHPSLVNKYLLRICHILQGG